MSPTRLTAFSTAVLAAATLSLGGLAHADDDPRNYYTLPDPVELDGVRIEFREAWAEDDYVKVKITIVNDSADYIFFHKHEAEFDGDFGTLAAHRGKKKKPVVIAPKKSKNHTWKVDGESGFLVKDFELKLGGFHRVNSDGEVVQAPNFQLPASRNDFEAGPFRCKLADKVYQETKETRAAFECAYKGEAIGWVDSAMMGVKVSKASEESKKSAEGMEFANDDKKPKKKMLKPGDKAKFAGYFHIEYRTTDMQHTVLQVVWRNTFTESKIEPLDVEEVEFEFDEALTREKTED